MDQRFTETTKHNTSQIGQIAQAFQQPLERIHRQLGFGGIPDIADTGAAVQVAVGGWLDIQFPYVRQAWMEDQVAFPFIEPVLGGRRDMPSLEECIGKDQPTLFVGFHLGHRIV